MTDQTQDVEANVDENEIVSEASMSDNPKDAEVASVTGVKAAANATKQTQPPKTKAGMIQGLMTKMQTMSKANLNANYGPMNAMMDKSYGKAEGVEATDEVIAEAEYDFSGDLNALVQSEATLSDAATDRPWPPWATRARCSAAPCSGRAAADKCAGRLRGRGRLRTAWRSSPSMFRTATVHTSRKQTACSSVRPHKCTRAHCPSLSASDCDVSGSERMSTANAEG